MKGRTIKFRCSESEKERIEGLSREAGTTTSEYCRQQSLTGRILATRRLSTAEIGYFRDLKIHNNGLARMANIIRARHPELAAAIAEYLGQSRQLYNRFF